MSTELDVALGDTRANNSVESTITSRVVARAAIIIMLGNILSRVLGLVREKSIAYYFGSSPQLAGYNAALRVQTTIYDLLISGVISAAFIPVFTSIRDDREELARVGGTILTLTVLAMAVGLAALELFAHDLIMLLAADTNSQAAVTGAQMLQVMSPSVLFLGVSGVLTALLYAKQRFVFPAFTPAIFNLSIVLGAIVLHHWLGITSLVVGVLTGAIGQVLLQGYGLRQAGLRPVLALHDPRVRQIGKLYLPVLLGLIITEAQVFIDTRFAFDTGTTSINYLNYATRIFQLPLGVVATAMSLASLPTLSLLSGAAYRATLARGLYLTLILMVPALIFCTVLAYPVITLLLKGGKFSATDVSYTAEALRYYAPGLLFAAVDQLLIFAFYAKNNTKTPVIVGVISIGFYLVVAITTKGALSFRGLALADSAKQISHAVILYTLLVRWQGHVEGFSLRGTLGKVLLAGAIVAVITGTLTLLVGETHLTSALHAALFLVVVGGGSMVLYIALLRYWRVAEVELLTGRLLARLRRGRA